MFYKLFINYLRVKMFQFVLTRLKSSRFLKSKNMKTMTIASYGLELLSSYILSRKKK